MSLLRPAAGGESCPAGFFFISGDRELESVHCNWCGKRLMVKDGIMREGGARFEIAWDYFSEKDGERHSFDLCEECYDELVNQFRIPVEVEEQTELL